MSIHLAQPHDLPYLVHLSKKNAEALGFLPRAAMAGHIDQNHVSLATENGDPCGYFLTGDRTRQQIRIFQACVQHDARGLHHGLRLLSSLITQAAFAGTHFLSLHCRDGLESNAFWSACGFEIGHLQLGGQARKKIVIQWELDIRKALSNPSLPYATHYIAELARRTSQGEGPLACPPLPRTSKGATILDPQETNVTGCASTPRLPGAFALGVPPHP